MNILDHALWVEKYRPNTVKDTILPDNLKAVFQKFVDNKSVPNLLLCGKAGVGKTTIAKAMLKEIDADYLVINGSMSGNIDTLRTDIANFASTVSFSGGRKYVILDEADYINPNSTQPALRNFMEEFSKNCGFILTCNFRGRIIEPLQSRCSVIEFDIPKEEKPRIAGQFFKRVCGILDDEGVSYDKKVVAELVNKYFPDWRRTLNELQRYSAMGEIDVGILTKATKISVQPLFKLLKEKNFDGMRTWVAEHTDIEPEQLFRMIYDNANEYVAKKSIPGLVVTIGEYQHKAAFVADQEINIAAFLTELLMECEFK